MKRTLETLAVIATVLMTLIHTPRAACGAGSGRPLVCIDPGHGGSDPGAVGNGLQEKDLNLDMALRARPLIEAKGYRVMMTRSTDVYVSLEDRCRMANNAGADLFMSIHNNAYVSTSEGTETFCYYNSEAGRRLATLVHQEVIRRIKTEDRGVKEAGFYVLKNTDMPAALLEGAFVTNEADAKRLADPGFRQLVAEGVAEGVGRFLVDPGRFDEYLLLMNTDSRSEAKVDITFIRCDGGRKRVSKKVGPEKRLTLRVDEYAVNTGVSMHVESKNKVPVVAERTMYFDFEKGNGGHGCQGVAAPSTHWYLAEGSTDWGFSTFILIQNTSEKNNMATVRFLRRDGQVGSFKYEVAPQSRLTLDVSKITGFERADFSVEVDAMEPVVVERAMYFTDYWGISGGHVSPGVTAPSRSWYLAEGYTGEGFHTFVLIGNPQNRTVYARVTFLLPGGRSVVVHYELPPKSRRTLNLNEIPGLERTDVSVRVDTDAPVVAERSMYFDYKGIREGSNAVGTPTPANRWYFAEGCTGNGFETYLLLMNPGMEKASVRLRFLTPNGRARNTTIRVPARSRKTVLVNDVKGLECTDVSARVTSNVPIVVERSVYFRGGARSGGHSSTGVGAPSLEWYFAEGFTG